jgi:hypothetical protein
MIDKTKTILAINPNAQFTITDGEITWLNNTAPISLEDITAKQFELQILEDENKQTKIDAKASALAKLSALGLTEEEVKAIIGI